MTESSIEEIVARLEMDANKPTTGFATAHIEAINALISSWRERGEALKEMQTRYEGVQRTMSADELRAALEDKP